MSRRLSPFEEAMKGLEDDFESQRSSDAFKARHDKSQSIIQTLRELAVQHYTSDDLVDPECNAIVLQVLSGPSANNEATTDGNLRKSVSLDNFKNTTSDVRNSAKLAKPIVVIARTKYDADLEAPSYPFHEDEAKVAVHSEFMQLTDEPWHSRIQVGSTIKVKYFNTENTTGYNGMPSGYISGYIADPPDIVKKFEEAPPSKRFNLPCQAKRQMAEPAMQLYPGHTVERPNVYMGPPIIKTKGIIKTGIYGNGTAQTKAHFHEALLRSEISFKHTIEGPAPDTNNAFVWVGHLKNNGFMDLVDRPMSIGRETIIYAPPYLDLSSPVEIKYYFHNAGGFGTPWINGPSTTTLQAIENVATEDNDFRTIIAPSIIDLVKDGRNFILVIPEMAYSKGFGTGQRDDRRINKMAAGEDVSIGEIKKTTVRSSVVPKVASSLREYLKTLPVSSTEDLLSVTHLRERSRSTFDGSFTGGNFGLFHDEVIEVLEEHLGTIWDKIGFVTITANGLGAYALASSVQNRPESRTQVEAAKGFRKVPINRIDFIDTELNDSSFSVSPAYTIYTDYLQIKAGAGKYIEFNYISEFNQSKTKSDALFTNLNAGAEYTKNYKKTSQLGENKMSFYVDNNQDSEAFVSMHMCRNKKVNSDFKVGYAMTMTNDFLSRGAVLKSDTNNPQKPSYSSVPDHADACLAMPSSSKILGNEYELSVLEEKITFFEDLLKTVLNNRDNPDKVCENELYQIYCDDVGSMFPGPSNTFVYNEYSKFWSDYLQYVSDKKKYFDLKLDIEYQLILGPIMNDKEALLSLKQQIVDVEKPIADSVYEASQGLYETFRQPATGIVGGFDLAGTSELIIGEELFGQGIEDGTLAEIARNLASKETNDKVIEKINKAVKSIEPRKNKRRANCKPAPQALGSIITNFDQNIASLSTRAVNCKGVTLSTPSTYDRIASLLPYFPKKEDFSFSAGKATEKINLESKNIGFEADTFKYKARAANNSFNYVESPPVWSCLSEHLAVAWQDACNASNYTPFKIIQGLRGSKGKPGIVAYNDGLSTHALGMAIDIDPHLGGSGAKAIYSVFTGAWNPLFIEEHGEELFNLGVFETDYKSLLNNGFVTEPGPPPEGEKALRTRRKSEQWADAPNAYKPQKGNFNNIMMTAKGSDIVPKKANPVLWAITFCEASGMKWGNAYFLKKRWRGGNSWDAADKKIIALAYGIPNIVDRIQAISWDNATIDNHGHFQYWAGPMNISWDAISVAETSITQAQATADQAPSSAQSQSSTGAGTAGSNGGSSSY